MKKGKKSKQHASYNQKSFLAPNSINSMAAMFTKIYKTGIAIIRVSDCNRTIKIWNDLNSKDEVHEMLGKIDTMISMLQSFREQVKIKDQYLL